MAFTKMINPSISPNVELEDILLAVKLLLSPFKLKSGEFVSKVESWFRYNFSARFAISFSAGRDAEYAILKALGVGKNDEVLIQAFTCVAVVNPILWLGAKPVYVDIDKETFSMNAKDLKKKITKKSRAIILQHSFGIVSNFEKVRKIARKSKIFLIEDYAHVINGSNENAKKLKTGSDAAFFSFGRDKAISSVFGGIVITNKKRLAEKVKKIKSDSPYPSYLWIFQQLLHPVITSVVLFLFRINPLVGKMSMYTVKKIRILSSPVLDSKQQLYLIKFRARQYPNALATIAYSQLMRIHKFNKKRLDIYNLYRNRLSNFLKLPSFESPYLRVPVLVKSRERITSFFKKNNIYIGDWYSHIVDPKSVNLSEIFYTKGQCRTAERTASHIINLPSYPTMTKKDAERVVKVFEEYRNAN